MSLEFDNPTNLSEMREIALEWIRHRPTIHHTRETLQQIRYEELNELYEAVILKRSSKEITLEVGDVLFINLALDESPNQVNMSDYEFFESFAHIQDMNLVDLFKLTHYKNRINYPVTFFNQMSPFKNGPDAISCIRILRGVYDNNLETLHDVWADLDTYISHNSIFIDEWHDTGLFREFIFKKLSEIKKIHNLPENKIDEIRRLKKTGVWDMKPLNIPNNQLTLRRWT